MKQIATIPVELLLLLLLVLYGQCRNQKSGTAKDTVFTTILTEKTVEDWEGDPEYWRFEDGVLIGEVTPENILAENSFFIWRGETVKDFELKVEYRISPEGNSGINYRSRKVESKKYVLRGYQADIDGVNRYSGQVYEEKGRSILARRSRITYVEEDNLVKEIGSVGEETSLSSIINENGWNEYHLIVRGNTHILMINGRVMSIAIDDGKRQKAEGLLGLQLHRGPPMKIEFRNLRLKQIGNNPS